MSTPEAKPEENLSPETTAVRKRIDYVRLLVKDSFPSEKKPEVEEAERIERLMGSDVEEA